MKIWQAIKAFFGFKPKKPVATPVALMLNSTRCTSPIPLVYVPGRAPAREVVKNPKLSYSYGGTPKRKPSPAPAPSNPDDSGAFVMGMMLGGMSGMETASISAAPVYVAGGGGDFGGGGASGTWDDTPSPAPAPSYESPAPSPSYESPAPSPSYESSSSSSSDFSSSSSSSWD